MSSNKPRILFLSHGGGPLPLIGDERHREMVDHLEMLAVRLDRPSAIIVVSAHWEESVPTVTARPRPPLIYDYYGFPEETYRIEYPCPGAPELAAQVQRLLAAASLESRLDPQRGFDHGLFVPLKIMYPDAQIPCIQVSLVRGLNPALHLAIGGALAGLDDDVLLIGSGFSFHNLGAFFAPAAERERQMNVEFERWLIDTCSNAAIDEQERSRRLEDWARAPHARYCHPREEHLLPLHVCYGAAGEPCSQHFELTIMDRKSSLYLW
jgi:4,5-DOPA dioxygenase extradiol